MISLEAMVYKFQACQYLKDVALLYLSNEEDSDSTLMSELEDSISVQKNSSNKIKMELDILDVLRLVDTLSPHTCEYFKF